MEIITTSMLCVEGIEIEKVAGRMGKVFEPKKEIGRVIGRVVG